MSLLEHRVIGVGRWPIVVIDDFHSDPMLLVDTAGDISNFKPYKNDYYPGVKQSADNGLYANNLERYSDALSPTFGAISNLQGSTYAIANSKPTELLPIQRIPHYDTADRHQLALVHYLCAPEWGGTAFYRHRSTNIECINDQNEQTFQQTLGREATTHGLPPADYINGDTSLFEQIGIVDARFNRAVIYPASLLHSGAIRRHQVCGVNVTTMRLTITAHLQASPENWDGKSRAQ